MTTQTDLLTAYRDHFAADPEFVVRAPGRVNLIGEHTDYNDGFVLPMAIDRATWIALRPRSDRQVQVHSLNLDKVAVFDLDNLTPGKGWAEYLKGMAWALQDSGFALNGWEGMLLSDVPIGAGLSSSAALELAIARAFCVVSGWEWPAVQMAQISQKADNQWVGIQSGIMDQMISAVGQAGHALLIDCRSLAHELVPVPPDEDGTATAVIILDTATRRGLVDSAYNERRAQCEAVAAHFGVPALRDISLAEFNLVADQLDPLLRQRARHVISENVRTLNAATAMKNFDARLLGQLMNDSHTSLRDDYAVSSDALNTMVTIAQRQPGCLGARMTGAGFGGCAVALVRSDMAAEFETAVAAAYQTATQLTPHIYICQPSDGAALVATP